MTMDFKDSVKQLGERVARLKDQIQTEEATKNAFVMPFIQTLGYDVFNPLEVVPEFTADIGIKQGEKVDYAILKNGKAQILIECKWWGANLDVHNSQLFRYFHTSEAKFGLLTNGIQYRFYTDLKEVNKMDEKPFLEFDITNVKEQVINELKKFHKSYFDLNQIVSAASELKFSNDIRSIFANELNNPTPDFVKYFVNKVYEGRATERVMIQFTDLVKKTLNQYLSDLISERLKAALDKETEKEAELAKLEEAKKLEEANKTVTTDDEMEGFFIVKAILLAKIPSERIFYRDFQYFFSVLMDDTIRQTVCRLYLEDEKKYISFLDENKKESKYEISKLDDIYKYSAQILASAEKFCSGGK
jgi:predicted type IV restriction endonuclease